LSLVKPGLGRTELVSQLGGLGLDCRGLVQLPPGLRPVFVSLLAERLQFAGANGEFFLGLRLLAIERRSSAGESFFRSGQSVFAFL
jgi:hypothetical protein